MPVTDKERACYQEFIIEQIRALGCVNTDPEATLWHYTNGSGFIGIIETGEIYATQVACLNDSTEIRYAAKLYRDAIDELHGAQCNNMVASQFLTKMVEGMQENPALPSHGPSRFFVACFTSKEDDLSQWRTYSENGGENGYALGFVARGLSNLPNGALLRVSYDKDKHKLAAARIAEATLRFFLEGLENDHSRTAEQWTDEFLMEWNDWINRVAPVVKDDCFRGEDEYRIVHELSSAELGEIRFSQKATLLSRYLPLTFPVWMQTRYPILPLARVMVGPGKQQGITTIGVRALLKQMGYGQLPVAVSQRPLQRP